MCVCDKYSYKLITAISRLICQEKRSTLNSARKRRVDLFRVNEPRNVFLAPIYRQSRSQHWRLSHLTPGSGLGNSIPWQHRSPSWFNLLLYKFPTWNFPPLPSLLSARFLPETYYGIDPCSAIASLRTTRFCFFNTSRFKDIIFKSSCAKTNVITDRVMLWASFVSCCGRHSCHVVVVTRVMSRFVGAVKI